MRRVWKILIQPLLTDIAADKMWKATGWVMEDSSVPAFPGQQAVFLGQPRHGGGTGFREE